VRGDIWVPAGRLGPGFVLQDELDMDMRDAQHLIAAHVARIGLQEPV
jgi:hypothetical protein